MAEFLVKVRVDDVDGCDEDELGEHLAEAIYQNCDTSFTYYTECDHGEEHEEEGDLVIRQATLVSPYDIAREARPQTIGLPSHPTSHAYHP